MRPHCPLRLPRRPRRPLSRGRLARLLRYDDPRWFSNHARNQEVIITSLAHHTGKILLASFVALALAATASARTDAKVIAHGALLKDGKTGYAQATAAKPASLSVMVQTTPAVKVKMPVPLPEPELAPDSLSPRIIESTMASR